MILLSRRKLLMVAPIALPLGALGCSGSGAGASRLPRVPPDPALHPLEREMFEAVNRERQQRSHAPLRYDKRLADVARYHAADMRDHRFFAHESPRSGNLEDRLDRAALPFATARENLAEAPTVPLAQQGLLKSPGHFANMMADDVTQIGVGVTRGGLLAQENLLFVQVFARSVTVESPDEARAVVLARIDDARRVAGRPPLTLDPKLSALADELVSQVDDAVSEASLGEAAQRAAEAFKGEGVSLSVAGQRVVAASEVVPPASLVQGVRPRAGIGVGPGKDERGRAAIKILVLVAAPP